MSTRARGDFSVKLEPQALALEDEGGGAARGRMSIAKRFSGDLEADSRGEMLTAMGTVPGSAGYVAIEKVIGRLQGRSGSFALQHTGTMHRGAPGLSVTVVPDSGAGELAGIAGTMNIIVEAGRHAYEFEYTLP